MKKVFIVLLLSLFFVSKVSALTEAPIDINKMSMLEISDALDKGIITSEQLVNMYLERIEAYDEQFNSINQLNENALEDAKKLDKERLEGKVRSKLHGVPILVKCNIDAKGIPTTAGTKSLSDNYPIENSFVVQKLIDAGAIVLGSTNMSELAFSAKNSYSSYGQVNNVFNVDYTPYGSSGGSAVAVSASFAAVALGTDTNSSVRLPAAGAGLVGLRPTLGLVSRSGVIPYDIERDTVGILSKTVEDNAVVLSIIGGKDGNDSYTKNSFDKEYDVSNKSLEGVRIGVATQYVTGSANSSGVVGLTDTDIEALVYESLKKMEDAGAEIIYLDDFAKYKYYKVAYSTYAGISMCDNFNDYIKNTTGSIRSFEELNRDKGHIQGLNGYVEGCGYNYKPKSYRDNLKEPYREYIQSFYDDYDLDVVVYPTLKNKVFVINEGDNNSPGSIISSVIGYPSVTVPMTFLSDGFSYGLEFLGEPYEEEKLLSIASSFEDVNNYGIVNSKLTPSLYNIDDNVTKLVNMYEDNFDTAGEEWLDEVQDYFKNYNNIEDKNAKALELINKFSDNDKTKTNIWEIILVVGLAVILLKLSFTGKKKKRKKRKRRK